MHTIQYYSYCKDYKDTQSIMSISKEKLSNEE